MMNQLFETPFGRHLHVGELRSDEYRVPSQQNYERTELGGMKQETDGVNAKRDS